jgi:Uma2 family endonuclease
MATLITDPAVEERIRAQRAKWGADRYDEVWEGTYMMTPMPNVQHQKLAARLVAILDAVIGQSGDVCAGANVSDREDGWDHNYRAPDVVVVMKGSRAKDCDTHYCGGPDFLVEIISTQDQSRAKLPFYSQIGVHEVMIIDRDPWCLELYRLEGGELRLIGKSQLDAPAELSSAVVPLSFRLLPGQPRPQIEVTHRDGVQRWIM